MFEVYSNDTKTTNMVSSIHLAFSAMFQRKICHFNGRYITQCAWEIEICFFGTH